MSAEREARLAAVMDELAAAVRSGGTADPAAAAARHPDLADDILELWPALLMAEEAGSDDPHLPPRFGDFEIESEIGRGGMGVVYRARQMSLDRPVALKVLLHGLHASKADLARFRAEAQSAANLDHEGIVPIHEVGEIGGRPFFTMQIVEGTTLAARLKDGPLPPREAAALLLPVARAIDHAHQQGILHRDLKPPNILIDESGRPLVTDFGLARRMERGGSLTRSGAALGTPGYMAPEQAAGSRGAVAPTTDVYGLGAVLYHAITGRAPFAGTTPVETLIAVLEQDPPPPRLLMPRADPDLELIAMKCLQKPPDLRYPTAAALADDLEAYLAGDPVAARTGSLRDVIVRLFRETHHAGILSNWGLLWMWHSFALLVLCLLTNGLKLAGLESPLPYIGLWSAGLGAWASIFWAIRRRAGPVTFVERQLAHVWGANVIACGLLFVVEMKLGLPVLTLSPTLGLFTGAVFLVKAALLTGAFYVQAAALYLTTLVMVFVPTYGVAIFGVVSWACFFFPGLKYHHGRKGV